MESLKGKTIIGVKEGHKVPICPEEKFKAIEEALRHFQMI